MAEERFIDDDKNRKYRIRINEAGEEELEIIDSGEEDGEQEPFETGLEVPEFEEDDEEAATMTPEQLFLARKQREEERAEKSHKAGELVQKAYALAEGGQEEYALATLDSAQNEFEELGEIYPLKLRLLTKNFTDLSRLDELVEVSGNLKKYSSAEEKESLSEFWGAAESELREQAKKNAALKAENEQKKTERRGRFRSDYKKSFRNFLFAFVPFIILLCLGIGFSTVMFADRGGMYLIITIVFFALAAVSLIASIVLARPLARDARRLRINERDNATALGRSYLEGVEREEKLKELCDNLDYVKQQSDEQSDVAGAVQNTVE